MYITASPDFTSYPQDTDLNIGDSIVLSCSASGDPPPWIAWERTDQRTGVRTVLSGSDIAALSNGGLPLVNVRQDDSGLYHCIADNQVDEIEATAIIRVQGWYVYATCIGHIQVYLRMFMNLHSYAHTNACIHHITHTYALHIHTYIYMHTHAHTHIHTHVHADMHTYFYVRGYALTHSNNYFTSAILVFG